MSALPKGWAETTLGEITEQFVSIDPTKEPSAEFRYVDIGSIDKSTQTIGEPKSFLGRDAPSRARRVIHEGDVLFSTVRTYLKNIAAVPEELDGALTSTGIAVLRASAAIDRRYLFNWVCSDEFVGKMSGAQDGTLYPAVTDKDVSGASVSLPPLPEQRRIVAKVDGLTARTARARKELDRIPTLIARYKQRLLALAFSGELPALNPAGQKAEFCAIGDIVDISSGYGFPKDRQGKTEGDYPFAKVSDISRAVSKNGGALTTAVNYVDQADLKTLKAKPIAEGSIVFAKIGEALKLNRRAITTVPLILDNNCMALTPDSSKVLSAYLLRFMETVDLGPLSVATAVPSVRRGDVASLQILLPSLVEQAEIVRRIESAFGWLDRMAADHAAAARLLPKLDAAVLAKAFRGELVPQDPTDEPASVLLERVKAEREAAPKGKRGRKTSLPPITAEATGTVEITGSATATVGRKKSGKAAMTKSRQDDDVKGKPYLAGLLKSAPRSDVQSLFRAADLPVADFYKQLAWEIDAKHIIDSADELKAA